MGFVRLACLIHAANVRSEPGSNPSKIFACTGLAPFAQPDSTGTRPIDLERNREPKNLTGRLKARLKELACNDPSCEEPPLQQGMCRAVRLATSSLGLGAPNCQRTTETTYGLSRSHPPKRCVCGTNVNNRRRAERCQRGILKKWKNSPNPHRRPGLQASGPFPRATLAMGARNCYKSIMQREFPARQANNRCFPKTPGEGASTAGTSWLPRAC